MPTGEDLGECPFCGLGIAASVDGLTVPSILHMLPTCEKFDKLDALEFITEVRKHREKQREN
jgi:hypothetical protein